jgi:alpha-galactosidase
MSLWSLLAAPLLAGNDVRSMAPETLEILLNREVIAVDQDRLGKQGTRLSSQGDVEIGTKALSDGATAVGVFNRGTAPANIVLNEEQLKRNGPLAARDLWLNKGVAFDNGGYSATIPQHGVLLLRIDLVK